MPEVTPCVILLEKTPILCNFIKLSPPGLPAGLGRRGRGAAAMLQKSPILCNFMRNSGAREQTGQLPKCRIG